MIKFPLKRGPLHGMAQKILIAYGIPAENVRAIMMLYENTRSLVRSPDGDIDFFDIKAGVLQGLRFARPAPAPLFIIILNYVMRTSVDKHFNLGFTLSERLSRRYPAKKLTDVDHADDLALSLM